MKLKEKATGYVQRIGMSRAFQKMWQSPLCRIVGRAANTCQENPFPAQVFLILLYRLALDILYLTTLSPLYAYASFTTNLSLLPYLCSWAAVLVFSPFIAQLNEKQQASSTLVTFLNFLYFIPLTSYCGCRGMKIQFFLVALVYWALLIFWQSRLPVVYFKPLKLHNVRLIMIILTLASCLLIMFISGRYTGFRFTLDIINVYDIRAEAASYSMPGIFSYALSMMPIVMSVLMLYWLEQKKWLVVAALIIVYLFLFSIGANKTFFFFLLILLACHFLFRPWMLRWMSGLMILATGVAFLERKLVGSFYLVATFFRRMMYIPVQISEQYFDFFQENPLNLFRYGIMGKFSFDNIYSTDITYLVAESVGEKSCSNNGLLGDLFANLPVPLGLTILPLILIICFRLLDAVSYTQKLRIIVPFCLFFASSFMNGSWSTVLLSSGFLMACLLLYFFPREECASA